MYLTFIGFCPRICILKTESHFSQVGKISCLAADLARVNFKEQEMLDVSRELLNTISALQVTASISVPLI